ncbi:MAG: hypothetical protein JRJ82_17515 [Deltaproteobacteria bacterium]|nr:hypothetical protein [Deltaproteobacteria bacterium]
MNIAIPVWEGKVSPVFDTASRLLILQVKDKKEASRYETYLHEQDLTRRCVRIQGLEVDVLICGAISGHFRALLSAGGINVIPWISGSAEDVLTEYLKGNLFHSKFLMPGCNWKEEKEKNRSRPKRGEKKKVPNKKHS